MTRDTVHRRIVLEFGHLYAYLYMTDGNGRLLPEREESWRQPYLMERKEVEQEAQEAFDLIWQHCDDTVNFPADELQDTGDDETESEEPQED